MNHENDRRSFLKTAGAALVAAAVPTAVLAQAKDARTPSGNNLKQMIVFGGVSEPNPSLPGVYGQICFQFQMCGDIGGLNGRGFATIFDPVLGYANSHIELQSGRLDLNDFSGHREQVSRPRPRGQSSDHKDPGPAVGQLQCQSDGREHAGRGTSASSDSEGARQGRAIIFTLRSSTRV